MRTPEQILTLKQVVGISGSTDLTSSYNCNSQAESPRRNSILNISQVSGKLEMSLNMENGVSVKPLNDWPSEIKIPRKKI